MPINSNKLIKKIAYGLYTVSAIHVFSEHFGCFILCKGDSMLPTIRNNDILWARRLHHHQLFESTNKTLGGLNKGDIVCLANPVDLEDKSVIKRIYRFIQKDRYSAPMEIEIRGDNASNSIDSRDYGPIPIGLIQYKPIYRLYPFGRRGRIE
ncbi:Peptidase_S24 domain-containing protein [Meloidogyne graminicola]|uniref:Peptidase_S24 domain-containing protein n=1 Tax=Meloidogyne graminicola TaxID=189291 RepID=A0A8S9ZGY3_9BILA|nr:Peptidase_S24 domain-containing protein [Meloidogyne graminicola]